MSESNLGLLAQFREELDSYDEVLYRVLPREVPLEKFKSIVITAMQVDLSRAKTEKKPSLLDADRNSLFDACIECAKDGLYPDGKNAAFHIRKNKVVYSPMVKGIIKMILKNTDVVKVESACVFKKDGFEFELGTNPFIRHRPNLEVPITDVEKDFRCVWAIFTLSNGEKMYDVMPKHEVDRRRTVSTGKNLPFWTMWYDRMARKSVIHRLSEDLDFDIKFEIDPDDSNETQDLLPRLAKPTPVIALPELPIPEVTEDDLPFDVDEGDGF